MYIPVHADDLQAESTKTIKMELNPQKKLANHELLLMVQKSQTTTWDVFETL